jgi:hypothetical protein
MNIQNDIELKQALEKLSIEDQRAVAAQFVESVLYLNNEPLIRRALEVAKNKNRTPIEFEDAYKNVKSLAVKSYTTCGENADWDAQAAHFVAEAAKACLTPVEQLDAKQNLAWQSAIQARMAKNCAMIESEDEVIDNEAQKQYHIVNEFVT